MRSNRTRSIPSAFARSEISFPTSAAAFAFPPKPPNSACTLFCMVEAAAKVTPRKSSINSEETREKNGTLPGAVLLSSYRDYVVARELPADRDRALVFYCHSPMCGAAAEAARKAVTAGYRQVWVMPEGIRGWARAGQPVAQLGVSS